MYILYIYKYIYNMYIYILKYIYLFQSRSFSLLLFILKYIYLFQFHHVFVEVLYIYIKWTYLDILVSLSSFETCTTQKLKFFFTWNHHFFKINFLYNNNRSENPLLHLSLLLLSHVLLQPSTTLLWFVSIRS